MFLGSSVALITPMHLDGSIDKEALHALVNWHLKAKTRALIIAGTTGESATLTSSEHQDLLSAVVKQVGGRIPVIAGTGTNSTQTTIQLTQQAEKAGVDGCLIVTPYYNRPPQRGLYDHYKTVAHATSLPIILYNVPGRTGCDLLPETVALLAKIDNIVGVKEAIPHMDRIEKLISLCGSDFAVYSGDDATGLDAIYHGAKGVISVTANIAPFSMQSMCQAALDGDKARANAINNKLDLLHERLFLESNPIPTKWLLHTMGKAKLGIRLPLLPLDQQYHASITEALQAANEVELEN